MNFDDVYHKLSKREIDIISCLLSGKSSKSMGIILNISKNTVETHVRNIMIKMSCHSKEYIINSVEQSSRLNQIKTHYFNLLKYFEYIQQLKTISRLIKSFGLSYKVLNKIKKNDFFLKLLKTCFEYTNVHLCKEQKVPDYFIHIVTSDIISKMHQENKFKLLEKRTKHIFVLCEENLKTEINIKNIYFVLEKDPYLSGFKIIDTIFTDVDISKNIEFFENKWKNITQSNLNEVSDKPITHFPFSKKRLIIWGLVFFILIFSFASNWNRLNNHYEAIRSDLIVPDESNVLARQQYIDKIEALFSSQRGIGVVVLSGIGGAGKTTLAKLYTKAQKWPVVWWFDAETRESLFNSFEHLAYALTETVEGQKQLEHIKKIKESEKKIKSLMLYIKNKIKLKKWFFVFDNVENLTDIQDFFPSDINLWGSGKIMITTRNSHIRYNSCINPKYIIYIRKLKNDEKIDLFYKIINTRETSELERKKTEDFIKLLPPFPLDVTIAAQYIKHNKTSYKEYLDYIHDYAPIFENTQTFILKEMGSYTKTRYGIITNSMKKILNVNTEFADLLLLISVIDSSNIPTGLLENFKGKDVADQFVHFMNKHSFLQQTNQNKEFLSIHRSIQENILQRLFFLFGPEKIKNSFNFLAQFLEDYTENIVKKSDYSSTNIVLQHMLLMFKYEKFFSPKARGILQAQIGKFFVHIGDYGQARYFLKKSLDSLFLEDKKCHDLRTITTMATLGLAERQLGYYQKASKSLEISLKLYQQKYPLKKQEIAWTFLHLGNVYLFTGNYKKAEEVLKKSISIYRDLYGDKHKDLACCLFYLGDVYRFSGKYKESKKSYEKSYNIYSSLCGHKHQGTLWAAIRLGIAYKDLGKYKESQKMLEYVEKIYKKLFPKDQDNIARIITHLGDLYRIRGEYKKSKKFLEKSFLINLEYFGREHIQTAWRDVYRCQLYIDYGQHDMARQILEKSLKIHKKHLGKNHIKIFWVSQYLAKSLRHVEKLELSKKIYQKSLSEFKSYFGNNHIDYAQMLREYSQIYFLEQNYDKAESVVLDALEIFRLEKHPECYICLEYLGEIYLEKCFKEKDSKKAEKIKKQSRKYFTQSLRIAEAYFPEKSEHIKRLKKKVLLQKGDHQKTGGGQAAKDSTAFFSSIFGYHFTNKLRNSWFKVLIRN